MWWVPVQLANTGDVVSLPKGVVTHLRRRWGGNEPATLHALLLPNLVALCQIIPVPTNLDT